MTQATDLAFTARRAGDVRLIGGVSAAHFVSHFYMLVLPPLFIFVQADYGATYTEIGLALTVFNAVSAIAQTPAGFLIDRINARLALVVGLVLGAVGFAVAGLVNSYWVLIAMFGLIGLGNTVYHPADYALLSRQVTPARMSQAYSVHTFSGMLGSAMAPGAALFMHGLYGWRGAFIGAAIMGLAVALVLLFQPDGQEHSPPQKPREAGTASTDWQVLLTAPILVNFLFFLIYAFASFGLQNFSVVALGALYGTSPVTSNSALSGYLLLSALGVLVGGWLVGGRIANHRLIAALGLSATMFAAVLIGSVNLGAALLILVMSLSGLFSGMVMPSRDLIVREVTPAGSFGKVFAFVTTGYHVAGILAPLLFGALLDHGAPRATFFVVAAFTLLAIVAVVCVPRRPPQP